MAIITLPGSTDANSYCTVAEANQYVSTRRGALWPTNSTEVENLLIESTRLVDYLFDWNGVRTSVTQSLEWPRDGVLDIPIKLKHAVIEAAIGIYASSGFVSSAPGVSSVEVGPIVVDLNTSQSTVGLSPLCISMLRGLGRYSGPSSGVKQVGIVRS